MAVRQSPFSGSYYEVPDDHFAPVSNPPASPVAGDNLIRSPYSGATYQISPGEFSLFQPREPAAAQAPEPPAPPDAGVHLTDYLKLYMEGSASLGQAANKLIEFSPLGQMTKALGYSPFEAIDTLASDAVDYWHDSLSPAMQEEMGKSFVQKNAFGEYEWGGAGAATLLGTVAESAPSMMLTAGIGGGITRVLQTFANPVGRSVLATRAASLMKAGVPNATNQALKKLRLVDKMIGAAGFGSAEGLIAGGQDYVSVYGQVQKLAPEKLAGNERWQQVYASTDDTMSEPERLSYATETVAREAASVAGLQSGLTTALLGAPMGAFFGSLIGKSNLGKLAATRTKATITAALGEATQEAAQSGVEQAVINRAMNGAGAGVDPMEGVLNAAVGGAAAGGAMGGPLGAAFHEKPLSAADAVSRGTFPGEDAFRRAANPDPQLTGPAAAPPPPDFVAGAEGVVRRPGETIPGQLALPAPSTPEAFAVDAGGTARPQTFEEQQAADAARAERVKLGQGPARINVPKEWQRGEATPQGATRPTVRFEERAGEGAEFRAARLKAFAKQHVDTGPAVDGKTLPAEADAYFDQSDTAIDLPLARLVTTKPASDKGGANALKRFAAAANGILPKRAPLPVRAKADGTFEVLDGNGTVHALAATPATTARVQIMELEVPGRGKKVDELRAFEKKLTPQQRLDLIRLRDDAAAFNPEYEQGMGEIAAGIGATFQAGGLKSAAGWGRIAEKTMAENKGRVAKLKDFVRGTILVSTPAQAEQALAQVIEKFGQAPNTSIRRGLLAHSTAELFGANDAGYADIKLNIPGPNGRTYEVQITTPEMLAAKDKGHHFYEVQRSIDAKAMERVLAKLSPDEVADKDIGRAALAGAMTPMEQTQWNSALKKQRAIYVPVFESFAASNVSKSASEIRSPSASIEPAGTAVQAESPGKSRTAPRVEGSSIAGSPSTRQKVVPSPALSESAKVLPSISQSPPHRVQSTRSELPWSNTRRVVTAAGTELEVEPVVVESGHLLTSDRGAYPQELQPRQRGKRAAASQQVHAMAANLDPELLGLSPEADRGAPIIGGDDMTVESGNGRVMAVRRAYAAHPERAKAYRDFIERQGFDTKGMVQPILVRRRLTPLDEEARRRFTVEANQSSTMALSAAEQAGADAALIDAAVLERLAPGEIASAANAGFVRAFLERLPESERNALVTADGLLSQEGLRRLEGALLAKAYGGGPLAATALGRILESTDDNVKSITKALLDVAPDFARLRQLQEDGKLASDNYAIQDELLAAVEQVAMTRAAGRSIEEVLRQGDFYGDMSALREQLIRTFYNRTLTAAAGREKIAATLRFYAQQAMNNRSDQGSLLAGGLTEPEMILGEGYDRAQPPERQVAQGRMLFSRAPQTDAFKRWFGDSKIVDADGAPLPMYHGTTRADGGEAVPSWFTSSQREASGYATLREGANVVPVYLSIRNPYEAKNFLEIANATSGTVARLKAEGYDGIIFHKQPIKMLKETEPRLWAVAFDGPQVKSAIGNAGAYDASNPSILASRGQAERSTTEVQRAVRAHLEPLIAKVSPLVNVRVVDSIEELADELDPRIVPADSEGAYLTGTNKVVFVTGNLASPERAEAVFLHEVFGHLAMERSPEMAPAIDMVLTMKGMKNRTVTELWNEVGRRQPRLDRTEHAKEVIALMAERGVKSSIMDRLFEAVRRILRSWGVKLQPVEAELRTLITRAARGFEADVRKGGEAAALAGLSAASSDAEIATALDKMPAGAELDTGLALQDELRSLHNEYPEGRPRPARVERRERQIEAALAATDRFTPWLDVQGEYDPIAALDRAREDAFRYGVPGQPLFSRPAPAAPAVEAAMDRVLSKAPESFTLRDKARALWQKLRNVEALEMKQGLIDQFASIEAVERAQNSGQLQDASLSAYKAALATKNLSSVMAAVMMRGVPEYQAGAYVPVKGRKGVLEIFRPLTEHKDGNLLRQWEFFAAANRAKRLKGEGRENLFTDAEIALGLALEQQYPEFRSVLTEWAAFNKQTLDLAEGAGIIDPTSRKVWENNDYVPFYRAMEEVREGPATKKTLANQRAKIKTLEGSDKQIGNVFENMMLNTAHLIDASFKNRAMQKIVDVADGVAMNKVDLPWEAVELSNASLASALRAAGVNVDKMTKPQREEWSTLFRRVAPRGPNIVSLMVNGKPEYYEVTDPLVLRSIAGMGQSQLSGLTALLFRGSKKLLTDAVTADPAFMIANFVRDTLSTWVQSDASMRPVIDAVKGLKATWSEDETLMQLMMAGSGGGGYYDANPEEIRKLVASKIEDPSKFMRSIVTPKGAWRVWRKIGAAAENANRVAVFKAVLKNGGTLAEAAYQARDVLNFSMRGDYGAMRWLVETVPFLNARVQGLYRLYRGARDNKKAFVIKGLMILAATMALGAANNDEPEYEELPEWDKDLYWHLFVGGEHFRIPKPFEVGAMFATIPERAWRGLSGRDSGKIVWDRILQMASDTFAFNPVPQLAKPIIEQYANRSFFTGSPIVGMAEANLQPEAQFTPFTSETLREAAQVMPDWAPEWIRSPRRLEAAVRGYTGSLGMYILGAADFVTREALGYPEQPAKKLYDFPVVQRFFRDENPRYTKYADQMYDMMGEANAVFSTINRFRREQRFEDAKTLLDENRGKLMVRARLNRMGEQVRRLNEQIRIVQGNRTMSADDKRLRIDGLIDRKNAVTRRVAPLADLF